MPTKHKFIRKKRSGTKVNWVAVAVLIQFLDWALKAVRIFLGL